MNISNLSKKALYVVSCTYAAIAVMSATSMVRGELVDSMFYHAYGKSLYLFVFLLNIILFREIFLMFKNTKEYLKIEDGLFYMSGKKYYPVKNIYSVVKTRNILGISTINFLFLDYKVIKVKYYMLESSQDLIKARIKEFQVDSGVSALN